ncbi:MAG: hypothetical protein WA418_24320 [Bradyrhizobium sp.]
MADRTSAFRISRVVVVVGAAVALMLSVEAAAARSGVIAAAPGVSGHAGPRPFVRHHRGPGAFLPAVGAFAYGPDGEPVPQQIPEHTSADVRYTYTYDVPWDWAHRYPPNVVPSDRPYVSSCPMQTVTVPGRGGEHTVNITRCY